MSRRILISSMLDPTGGCETHLYYLCKTLRADGNDVTIAAQHCELNAEWRGELEDAGVRLLTPPTPPRSPALRQLRALAHFSTKLRREFDLLVGVKNGGLHRLLLPFLKPGGFSIYNLPTTSENLTRQTLFGMRGMDGVITMSPRISEALRRDHGLTQPIAALPHLNGPIDPTDIPLARPAPAPDEPLRVAFFGRLNGFKRPDLLVRLWPTLRLGPAHLDIYGDGERLEACRRLVEELDLSESVRLHGAYRHQDARQLMSAAHLIVLPSNGLEGLPQVLVEALACGVPFVATDVGGIAELGEDNPNVIVTDCSEASIRQGIERMAARVRSGDISPEQLRRIYRERYAFETVLDRWRHALTEPHTFFERFALARQPTAIPAVP